VLLLAGKTIICNYASLTTTNFSCPWLQTEFYGRIANKPIKGKQHVRGWDGKWDSFKPVRYLALSCQQTGNPLDA